ncbi:MAG: NAD-dependent epimerase/dehydratase family protein, partial [Candidatus Brocadiae bacterium]|nr:NAD-dependent epimerase/dehydratase family protein [Candidatus Brocadiia bacterium]
SGECDLTRYEEAARLFADVRPEIVVHAAADVGGIGYNRLYPADIFRNNLLMACNVLEACRRHSVAVRRPGVQKLVIVGSSCAYPGEVPATMREADFLAGPMHPSVECYGFSKRALYLGAKAYGEQFGLNSIFLLVTNMYGPHDKFDPKESHVVAALVRKFVEACDSGDPAVECWGTGAPVREFLYVEDCAEAVLRAAERYEGPDPLNVGTGIGTSIRELAETIARITEFDGEVCWDATKPDGAMKKVLDVSRMVEALDWSPPTGLEEGLGRTIEWYRANRPGRGPCG